MDVRKTKLEGVLVLEPRVFSDERGYFMETWNRRIYEDAGIPARASPCRGEKERFVQDNVAFSRKGVLRGLHFQHPHDQGKLVQVPAGEVFDVAVDIRVESKTFGQWVGEVLSEKNHRQMYVPAGFAHGYCVLSETALFSYKCTDFYDASAEGGIIWNDPDIGIDWPVKNPILSVKDAKCPRLKDLPAGKLPRFEVADGR